METILTQAYNQIFGDMIRPLRANHSRGWNIKSVQLSEADIAKRKKEEARQAYLLQRETEEINMDNRIFDAQN